jgi:hypothetical protein
MDAGPQGVRQAAGCHQDMTGLLEEALRRVESLSQEEQDAIASQILETLDDEEAWRAVSAGSQTSCESRHSKLPRNTGAVKRGRSTN